LRPTVMTEWGSQSNQIVPKGFVESFENWAMTNNPFSQGDYHCSDSSS
jgi:hypothetical protein